MAMAVMALLALIYASYKWYAKGSAPAPVKTSALVAARYHTINSEARPGRLIGYELQKVHDDYNYTKCPKYSVLIDTANAAANVYQQVCREIIKDVVVKCGSEVWIYVYDNPDASAWDVESDQPLSLFMSAQQAEFVSRHTIASYHCTLERGIAVGAQVRYHAGRGKGEFEEEDFPL